MFGYKLVKVEKSEAEAKKEPGKLKKVASTAAKVLGTGLLATGAFLVGREYQRSEGEEEAPSEEDTDLNSPDN